MKSGSKEPRLPGFVCRFGVSSNNSNTYTLTKNAVAKFTIEPVAGRFANEIVSIFPGKLSGFLIHFLATVVVKFFCKVFRTENSYRCVGSGG